MVSDAPKPVCLTRSAPHDSYSDQLMFYDVVDSSVYSQSSVLSSIVEAGGDAVLPDGITLTEFKAWLTAVKAEKAEVEKWSFSSFCTVLKVADVLGDERIEEWIKLAAYSLPPESNWLAGACSPEEASEGIEKLSHLLRRRVLAKSAVNSTRLCRVLDFLPSKHHAEVLEATIPDTKCLEAPLRESLHVAKALASVLASPPSFVSLDVHDFDPETPIAAASTAGQQASSYLSAALHQHSSLTSLQLKLPCITSSSLELLSHAIASLKPLQALLMHTSAGPDSIPTLQQTFAALSNLQQLSISFAPPENLKRRRDDEPADLPQYCMTPMLSAATALTSLELLSSCESEYVTATSAVSLPQLSHLTMKFACKHTSAAATLLSHLSAPLTSLDMHHDSGLSLPPAAAPDARRLFTSLAKFTHLQALKVASPYDEDASSQVILDAVSEAAPPALAALPHLSALNITTEFPVIHLTMQRLAAARSGLTELILRCSSNASQAAWDAWPEFLQQLTSLKLQRLRVTLSKPDAVELPGLAVLPLLPHLTALSIDDWACLKAQADCDALASITQLQKLHLVGMRLPAELREGCARCLRALSALTSLQFRSATPEGSISGVLEDHVPEGALGQLQELGLDFWWPSQNQGEEGAEAGEGGDGLDNESEDAASEGDDVVVTTIVSTGNFANHLPAVMRLDLLLEANGTTAVEDCMVGEWLQDIELESDRGLELSHEGELPF